MGFSCFLTYGCSLHCIIHNSCMFAWLIFLTYGFPYKVNIFFDFSDFPRKRSQHFSFSAENLFCGKKLMSSLYHIYGLYQFLFCQSPYVSFNIYFFPESYRTIPTKVCQEYKVIIVVLLYIALRSFLTLTKIPAARFIFFHLVILVVHICSANIFAVQFASLLFRLSFFCLFANRLPHCYHVYFEKVTPLAIYHLDTF